MMPSRLFGMASKYMKVESCSVMDVVLGPVIRMVLQRIALGFLSLLVVSLVIFFAVNLLPGTFATAVLGSSATPDTVAAFEHKLGLDQPMLVRYFAWLISALHADFGMSFSNRPVADIIGPRLLSTVKLASITAAIAVPLAILLGIICARYRSRLPDRTLSSIALAAISVPHFFIAYVLMFLLTTKLHIFPSLSSIRTGMTFGEQLYRMALPIMTLLVVVLAYMMRNTRAAILNVMSRPYIEMAQLKGESEMRVLMWHAVPNAIGSIASVVAINLAYLITGVVVVEVVFVYPGIGSTMVDAVRNRDIPVIQACTLIFAATYIVLNLIADVVAIVSNPRLLHSR